MRVLSIEAPASYPSIHTTSSRVASMWNPSP